MAYCRFLIALAAMIFLAFLSSNSPSSLLAADAQKIVITSPVDQSTVNETINIEGTYAKELNAHAIQVFIYQAGSPDPAVNLGANFASPFKFTWNTRKLKNGFWIVVAQAVDANGQKLDSSYVGMNVNNDWIAPIPYFTFYSDQGEIVSGMVTLTGGATDNVGVERAEFWIGDKILASFQGPGPYKYKWDTTPLNNGKVDLRIVAYDKAGNKSGTPSLSYCLVEVQNPLKNPVPPVVKITSPKDDATVSGVLMIKGDVLNDKDLDHVDFAVQAGNLSKSIKKGQPYQAQWDTKLEQDGNYWIHMYAYKKNNFILGEHKVNVTVNNLEKPLALAPKLQNWVNLISPKAGATLSDTVKVEGTVTGVPDTPRVSFQAGAIIIGDFWNGKSPFHSDWDTHKFQNGPVSLSMLVYDAGGQLIGSDLISVTVKNAGNSNMQVLSKEVLAIALSQVQLNGKNLEDLSRALPLEELRGKEALLTGRLENYARVSHLEVSLDGGRNWETIPAKADWSYRFKPVENKDYDLKFRAVMNDRTLSALSVPVNRFRYAKPERVARMKGPSKPQSGPAESKANALSSSSQESMEQQDMSFGDSEMNPS